MAEGQNKLKCAICYGYYNKPKFIPCYHTFCLNCLTRHIEATASDNRFECPVCRASTGVPERGARGFSNNIYIEEVHVETILLCSEHKKTKLKFYCRDCSVAICRFCRKKTHSDHKVDDLATVEDEHKQHLKPLTEELEKKVAELNKFSESLKHTITDINTTADNACKNVDKQTKDICQQLREQAQEIKQNIKPIQDDSKITVQELMEAVSKVITLTQAAEIDSCDASTSKPPLKSAVDILPKNHSLIESCRKLSIVLPEVIYIVFSLSDTVRDASFTVEMNEGIWYRSDVIILQTLSWRIGVFRRTTNLDVYLELTSEGDERKSCTADATLKLVNHTVYSQSVVVNRVGGEYASDWMSPCALSIDWNELTDPNNGFLQNNRFTTIASVNVTRIDNE